MICLKSCFSVGAGILLLVASFTTESLGNDIGIDKKIAQYVEKILPQADIPGLSIVVVHGNKRKIFNYGYADPGTHEKVSSQTLFELGSCSKAFTALAVMNLVHQKRLRLDADVREYIPWFRVRYKDKPATVTIRQLLHHTSGIPWNTISKIPPTDDADALEKTVKRIINQQLNHLPGKEYEYATINYDALALVIQKITGRTFESYVKEQVLDVLGLHNTSVGSPVTPQLMAQGHKLGFFEAREYDAPVYKGNNAAGYVISNAEDVARWLKFQMGQTKSELFELTQITHQRDETVPVQNTSSYAMGWQVSLSGTGEISHTGLNPNFTSYMAFRPRQQIGVAILANSSSSFTYLIGQNVMNLLAGEEVTEKAALDDANDKTYSVLSFAVMGYTMLVLALMAMIAMDIFKKRRDFERFSLLKLKKFMLSVLAVLPFLIGLYILPEAIAGFTWEGILVWTPVSFAILVSLILAALSLSYLAYLISLFFPEQNKYKRLAPIILLMSIFAGISNMVLILIITSSLESSMEMKYMVFYYMLPFALYIFGRRFVQINLIKLTNELIFDLRIDLIGKIFSTSYQKFEKIDHGKVYTALNDDVSTIGSATNLVVTLITNFFTVLVAFMYLASVAFWATVLTAVLIIVIASIYYYASTSTNVYFEKARDLRDVFVRSTNGMIEGFKEISLHVNKKLEYKQDMSAGAEEYKDKISFAQIRFVDAFLIGETLLIMLLGVVAFAVPELFPNVQLHIIVSFIVILLYLIGPINGLLNCVPSILQLRIAWNRIQQFLKDIPAASGLEERVQEVAGVESYSAKGIKFRYSGKSESFGIGPIDLEVKRGEIVFIIGGNGSGKTTFAKLLTGLYEPTEGEISINGKVVKYAQLGEYFSVIFSPMCLFSKLYNVDAKNKSELIDKFLKVLNLKDKVQIKDNEYTTVDLSGGQRKRLALLQCYLEDSPIFLFDEWAADQDPVYRKFFYRTLLPEMRKIGKIVIAITHDDHYFDVADKVFKMNDGRLEVFELENQLFTATKVGEPI